MQCFNSFPLSFDKLNWRKMGVMEEDPNMIKKKSDTFPCSFQATRSSIWTLTSYLNSQVLANGMDMNHY